MNDFIQGNHEEKFVKKPLPVGISDYRRASTEYYYVDKTMMIKEFIDERPLVSLFTRPRRFGKTLNMDMLRTFFGHPENPRHKTKGQMPVILQTTGKQISHKQNHFIVKSMHISLLNWDIILVNNNHRCNTVMFVQCS